MSSPLPPENGYNPKNGFKFPWPFPKEMSRWYRIKSRIVSTFVYACSKFMFCGLNKMTVENRSTFIKLVEEDSRPLITISNHRCTVDDPLVWALMNWSEFFRNIDRFRYTLAAHDICFTKPSHTYFFALGRCVPIVRGAGLYQEGMDYCIDRLNNKAWVHIYPEGKITPVPVRIKWGVARLIMESKHAPWLLPIWVDGMDTVWAKRAPYYPIFGKTVHVTIGEPIDTAEILSKLRGKTEDEKRKELADYVQESLYNVKNKPKEKVV